jgi:hypothetical protein
VLGVLVAGEEELAVGQERVQEHQHLLGLVEELSRVKARPCTRN